MKQCMACQYFQMKSNITIAALQCTAVQYEEILTQFQNSLSQTAPNNTILAQIKMTTASWHRGLQRIWKQHLVLLIYFLGFAHRRFIPKVVFIVVFGSQNDCSAEWLRLKNVESYNMRPPPFLPSTPHHHQTMPRDLAFPFLKLHCTMCSLFSTMPLYPKCPWIFNIEYMYIYVYDTRAY